MKSLYEQIKFCPSFWVFCVCRQPSIMKVRDKLMYCTTLAIVVGLSNILGGVYLVLYGSQKYDIYYTRYYIGGKCKWINIISIPNSPVISHERGETVYIIWLQASQCSLLGCPSFAPTPIFATASILETINTYLEAGPSIAVMGQ